MNISQAHLVLFQSSLENKANLTSIMIFDDIMMIFKFQTHDNIQEPNSNREFSYGVREISEYGFTECLQILKVFITKVCGDK